MTWNFYPATCFDEHATDWDYMNSTLYDSHPLLDSRFVAPLVRQFGTPEDVLAVRIESRRTTAMTILRRAKWGIWQSFLPSQAQIAPSLLPNAQSARSLVANLPPPARRLDLLCQDEMYSPWSTVPPDATATSHAVTIAVNVSESFDDYWSGRPKNLRKNLSKWRNRIRNDGHAFRLATYSIDPELTEALRRYSEMELQGWKGTAGTAIDLDDAQGIFYSDVLDQFSQSGDATIYELLIDGLHAASRIAIKSKSNIVILKTTYNEALAKYAPGRLLLYCILERIHKDTPEMRVEFYTNATPEQSAWATEHRTIQHISIYRNAAWQTLFRHYASAKKMIEPLFKA